MFEKNPEEQQALHRPGPSVGTAASCSLSLPPTPIFVILRLQSVLWVYTSGGEQRHICISAPVWRPYTCLPGRRLGERFSWAISSKQDFPQASPQLKTMLINPMSDFPWPKGQCISSAVLPLDILWEVGVFSPLLHVLPFLGQGHGRSKAGCKCCWVEVASCAFIFSYLHSNVSTQVHQCIIICTFSGLDAVLQKSASTHSSASHLQARLCFPLRVVRNTTNFRY